MDENRLFLHEAPERDSICTFPSVQISSTKPDVVKVVGPKCHWNVVGRYFVEKIVWMTNSPLAAERLEKFANNTVDAKYSLERKMKADGSADGAQSSHPEMVQTLLDAVKTKFGETGELGALDCWGAGPSPHEVADGAARESILGYGQRRLLRH